MSSESSGENEVLRSLVGEDESYAEKRRNRRRQDLTLSARFEDFPGYRQLQLQKKVAAEAGINVPFFTCAEGMAKDTTVIKGRKLLNFSAYDYLGLNGSEPVNAAAARAMELYGTSAGASRIASGERPPHQALEKGLAAFLGYPDCLTLVSGYMTNVTVVAHLFGKNDLVAYDALSHNSLVMGGVYSGADRFIFPHNDVEALDRHLTEVRGRYARVLVMTEGLFGMDGTVGRIPELIALKKRHNAFLMVDEAHSLGVLGKTGRGVSEHFGVPSTDIDINMGTLSKVLCGCGGYIAGSEALIHFLRYTVPGFMYSVAMSPPVAAAINAALGELDRHPERVARLQALGGYFLKKAHELGLNTGPAIGQGLVPVIVGNSLVAVWLSSAMFERGVNVLPVIYPVVPEGTARLRFFLTCEHKEEQIDQALAILLEELPKAKAKAAATMESAELGDEAE